VQVRASVKPESNALHVVSEKNDVVSPTTSPVLE